MRQGVNEGGASLRRKPGQQAAWPHLPHLIRQPSDLVRPGLMGYIVAVVNDLHCGSTIGLSPPRFTLDDGGEYIASKTQMFLWDCWGMYWRNVAELKASTGYKLLTVFCGDIAEGDFKNRSHQLISRNKATVMNLTRTVIDKPVDLSDWLIFIRGTNSHTGRSSWMEEEIASDFDTTVKNGNSYSWDFWRGIVGGLPLDFEHFVRLGNDPWTKTNPLGKLAAEIKTECLEERKPYPLAIRAHRHQFADTYDNHDVRVVVNGCFQGSPGYASQMGIRRKPNIGGLIVRIDDDGQWTLTKKSYKIRAAKLNTLP